jgi:glutamine synthetase
VNSYKRLVPGYEAPVYIAWSARNRSPLIRVPTARGDSTRLELRNPDPSCNPYLALAGILTAGLDGIENNMEAPKPVNGNVFEMDCAEREKCGIPSLPENLQEALWEMEKSGMARELLGEHVFEKFIDAKTAEWDSYRMTVSPWEIDSYLTKY